MANTLDALSSDLQIIEQWNTYFSLAISNGFNPGTLPNFIAKINVAKLSDVAAGRDGGYSLKETILAVLEACIWNYKTSWEEKMRLAEEHDLKKFLGLEKENLCPGVDVVKLEE